MNEIYILLMYLPSAFGRLTQKVTKYQYTHVALSLDDKFDYFYAFSRLRAKTAAVSGYIEEKRIYYTLGEDVPIQTKIFKIPVAKENYQKVIDFLEETRQDPEIMYNLIQMLLLPWVGGRPVYKAYNCGEFIAKIVELAGIPLQRPYYQYMPRYFSELLAEYEIYEGVLENSPDSGMEDDFFRETPWHVYLFKTCYILRELIYRQIFKRPTKRFQPAHIRFQLH